MAKGWLRYRLSSIPAWVIVLAVAAIVGATSAAGSVVMLSRYNNRSAPPLEVPVQSGGMQDNA
jgi:hypothetical protein